MRIYIKGILLLMTVVVCAAICGSSVQAQDAHFSQFYANPIYLNPAFAGSSICPRVHLNYRNQWGAISGDFVTYSASYDQFVQVLQGGVGLRFLHDRAGQATYSVTQVGFDYAYHQRIANRWTLNFGVEVQYHQRKLDWSKLLFGDQIDNKKGFILPTQEQEPVTTKGVVDFSSGLLVHNKHAFFGVAVNHLTEPDESIIKPESPLPMKFTAHAGLNFYQSHSTDVMLSPNVLYQQQGDFKELNVGVYTSKGPLVAGLWTRLLERDAVILVLGIKGDMVRVGYSYDVTISKLSPITGGSHEFSMAFQFDCKPKKPKLRPIFCPSF
ncbi:MAG: type IX secretion system membrane protein PorP/SprF [Flavobacteriales bacterium]|nr:type IX secretion system membrane protein PorP/SprF [Flavobacteriales bacterium]MCB9447592.1 type IX secretion system membrane protein PorP/SprF [Flavobacteriales bacterium]